MKNNKGKDSKCNGICSDEYGHMCDVCNCDIKSDNTNKNEIKYELVGEAPFLRCNIK